VRRIFVDTHGWIAWFSPRDRHHQQAVRVTRSLRAARVPLVTTDLVLTELLGFFAEAGPTWRSQASQQVETILADPNILTLPSSRGQFQEGLTFYRSRLDKGYSLVDCISMCLCHANGWHEVLTHDHHFAQEGFILLL
jgi:uncharacterized protein